MAAAAAAVPVALPLAEKAVQASVDLTKSVVAQVFDALRTPLLGAETVVLKETRKGSTRTTYKANLPAWAAVAAGVLTLAFLKQQETGGTSGGHGFLDLWLAPISWTWGGWPWNPQA